MGDKNAFAYYISFNCVDLLKQSEQGCRKPCFLLLVDSFELVCLIKVS
jgi:hypothetical protein